MLPWQRIGASVVLIAVVLSACAQPPASPTNPGTNSPTNPPAAAAPITPTAAFSRTRVTFPSGSLTLEGYVYKPAGNGPFPTIVWNHGSDPDPASSPELGMVAGIFVPAGFAVFAPVRRGQGGSQGDSLPTQMQQVLSAKGSAAAQQFFVQQMTGSQLDDQLAGLAYLKTLSYVDQSRLVVGGCGYGGIQAFLGAAQNGAYKAAVAISPGSESWDGNSTLQQSLVKTVSSIKIPVFLIHPEKDVSVQPGYTLAQEFLRQNKPYAFRIYPPFGSANEQGECFGDGQGYHWWASDAVSFVNQALSPSAVPEVSSLPHPAQPIRPQKLALTSKDGTQLVGYLYKPAGPGPFPAVIWNHGSEQDPEPMGEFDGIAYLFVPAGYVVVDPVRRGQGGSQGTYISDQSQQVQKSQGKTAAEQFVVQQFGTTQLDDELSGLNYLKSLPYVDQNRLAVVGCSYGGIMTLMGAEAGQGYKAAVAISPAAESWANPYLQKRLLQAVDNIQIPTMIIHPAQDASLEPGYNLGPEFQRLGKPYGLRYFPPFGSAVQHCFGGDSQDFLGLALWGPEALTFLQNVLH